MYGQIHERLVVVLDGQGGGMGAQLVKLLLPVLPEDCRLIGVGTNALATGALLRAGVHQGASGENAVIYNAGRADLILGPIGIIVANGICGEVSPAMAAAVAQSPAHRHLLPFDQCSTRIAGMPALSMSRLVEQAVEDICRWAAQQPCPTAL